MRLMHRIFLIRTWRGRGKKLRPEEKGRGWLKAHEHWRFCVLRAATQPTGWFGTRALLLPALVALYAWDYKSRGHESGVRDQEMLEDFVGQEAASFGQANGIFGSLQQFLFFSLRDYGVQWN